MRTKIILAGLLAIFLGASAQSQPLDKPKLDKFFDRLAEKNKAMGSIVMAKDDDVLYTRSIGYSQIGEGQKAPINTATRFRVGSIAKLFTTALVFQLVEDQKLRLDETIDKFFPQLPNAKKITVAHLLSHRSGIKDIVDVLDFRTWKTQAKTKDELLSILVKSAPEFEPGAKFSYSNSGFILLGLIVEKLTGKTYDEVIKRRILSKFGLKDTYIITGPADVTKNESLPYKYVRDWERQVETHPSIPFAAGAIVSTPSDLAVFASALFGGKIVSKSSLAAMLSVKDGYGLGMDSFTFAGRTMYGHTGNIDNFGAWLAYLTEEKLAVVYTSNARVYPMNNIMAGVFDIYWNRPFEIPEFKVVEVSPEILDKYVGVYSNPEAPAKFIVTRDGPLLMVQQTGGATIPLEATAIDKFKVDQGGIVVEFDADKGQMTVKRSGRDRIFTKEK